jgi:hypothetical protein
MEETGPPDMFLNIYHTIRWYSPEEHRLTLYLCENQILETK